MGCIVDMSERKVIYQCPFEDSENIDCLRCYQENYTKNHSEDEGSTTKSGVFCWNSRRYIADKSDSIDRTERTENKVTLVETEVFSETWVLSKTERKWIEKQKEYIWSEPAIKKRLEAIFFFCHRNQFKCRLVGKYVFVATSRDEWLIDYARPYVHLNHLNTRGNGYHFQNKFAEIRPVLYYIRNHSVSRYYRFDAVGDLLKLVSHRP